MNRKSPGAYVLAVGIVILVGGLVLLALPGPGLLVLAAGVVVTSVGVVLLLADRNAAKVRAMGDPLQSPAPPQ